MKTTCFFIITLFLALNLSCEKNIPQPAEKNKKEEVSVGLTIKADEPERPQEEKICDHC